MAKKGLSEQYKHKQSKLLQQKIEKEERESHYDFWIVNKYISSGELKWVKDKDFHNALLEREKTGASLSDKCILQMYLKLRKSFGWKYLRTEEEKEYITQTYSTPTMIHENIFGDYEVMGGERESTIPYWHTWDVYYRDPREYGNYERLVELENAALDEFFAFVSLGYVKYPISAFFLYGNGFDILYDSFLYFLLGIGMLLTMPISIIIYSVKNRFYRQYRRAVKQIRKQVKEEGLLNKTIDSK